MFVESQWHGGSAYGCQGENANSAAAEICQDSGRLTRILRATKSTKCLVYEVTITLRNLTRTWEAQASPLPPHSLQKDFHRDKEGIRSLLLRPLQLGTDSLIGKKRAVNRSL